MDGANEQYILVPGDEVMRGFLTALRKVFSVKQSIPNGRPAISPDVRASFHDDGVVFLDLRGGAVFRSNRIGAVIWKGLAGRKELAEIAAEIGREYRIPLDEAMADASAFVTQLETRGFLLSAGGGR